MADRGRSPQRAIVPTTRYDEDLRHWVATERRIALRVLDLVTAIRRDPFGGIGKPEPLKGLGPNMWSRRITEEHRLVYRVFDDRIELLRARGHYDD